ncbi:MAG TPA: helix-turn-helix domain-containing protein [Pseudonocardia sp.]|nr:helix-turn-helix domain-containing protein [Pseudonocardia sp.]
MSEPVKPNRRYDTTRRQQQARENRGRILAAGRELFLAKGYAEAAMPEIAQAAGVSVQTVYKAFANKATLLKAVFDVSVAGDDESTPMAERDVIGNIRATPDAATKIALYAAHLAEGAPRHAPLQLLARDAAGADRTAAAVWAQMRAEVLTAMTHFAADLLATGQVRPGLAADDVRDVLWTYHAPELYELLVLERDWSADRYGRFLTEAMTNAVLGAR